MKLVTTLAIVVLTAASSTSLTKDAPASTIQLDESFIACAFYPLCDLDINAPVPQPKDKTIDTQDKDKDSKVA